MTTQEIAERLVALCREGKNLQAVDELYSPDIVSIESMSTPAHPAEIQGIQAVRGKNEWWLSTMEVHSGSVDGPVVARDVFSVAMTYDVTDKNTQRRMSLSEIAVYEVAGDKIVRERFVYRM